MNIAQPDSRHSTGILYQWVNWMGKEKKSFTIYLHFSPKALKERNSVGGNISRWIASVNKAWGLWPLKDLCTCRWEIAWYLTWPILAEIKNFLIIFPNSSARESWSYAAYFKDKPLKKNKADTGQTGRVTITSPKVNIYHQCWAGPLLLNSRKNEGRHKMITPTVDCWGPEAVCLWDAACVWQILCSAFSLVSYFPMIRQGSLSAGSTHRPLHLQKGWFPRFQHNCSASH